MNLLISELVVALYILGAAGFVVFIFRPNKRASQISGWVIRAGFVLQTLSLIIRTIQMGQIPILNVTEALGFYSWTLVGAYLLLSIRFHIPVMGAFASPLAAVMIFLSWILPVSPPKITPIFQSIWFSLHLGSIFIGYGFLAMAFVAGMMYVLQERQIKNKHTTGLFHRLPSLNALDALNYQCLTIGFPLMTIGIITGAIYAQVALGSYWSWDPKEVWALVTWLIYAGLLHQRLTVGWRGRRAAIMSAVGFAIILFTFFAVSYILPGYHSVDSLKKLQGQPFKVEGTQGK